MNEIHIWIFLPLLSRVYLANENRKRRLHSIIVRFCSSLSFGLLVWFAFFIISISCRMKRQRENPFDGVLVGEAAKRITKNAMFLLRECWTSVIIFTFRWKRREKNAMEKENHRLEWFNRFCSFSLPFSPRSLCSHCISHTSFDSLERIFHIVRVRIRLIDFASAKNINWMQFLFASFTFVE